MPRSKNTTKTSKIVWLKISSWSGISIGAVHIYGELIPDGSQEGVSLEKTLTATQARKLNKWYRQTGGVGGLTTYRAGYKTTGFDDESELTEFALKTYREHFPKAELLIKGQAMNVEPQLILDGPSDVKEKAERLLREARALEYWEHRENYKRMDALSDEWEDLLKPFRGTDET